MNGNSVSRNTEQRGLGKKQNGRESQSLKKAVPLSWPQQLAEGLRSDMRTVHDNAASVQPLADSDPAGESDHRLYF